MDFCQAQSQLQLSWTELALFSISPLPMEYNPNMEKYLDVSLPEWKPYSKMTLACLAYKFRTEIDPAQP